MKAHKRQNAMGNQQIPSTDLRLNDSLDTALNVGLKHMCLCEFLVPVSSQPDASQRALLAEHKVSIEHRANRLLPTSETKKLILYINEKQNNQEDEIVGELELADNSTGQKYCGGKFYPA